MADAQPADPAPTDVGTLVGAGGDKGTLADLVKVDRAKVAEDLQITREADKRLERDQARAEKQFQAEGVSAAEIPKPWNAEAEHRKYESNPIDGFGSAGAIFAMAASAFTRAPMENAINGMAGAINSIQQGNEDAYKRAHEAWKDNTRLAMDRFKMQHELYQDAFSLMDHNMTAANAKLHNSAVRFGDNQMLMLAEHGMVKEMFELQAARASAAEKMMDLSERTTEMDFKKTAIRAMQRGFQSTGDPNQDKIAMATQALRILKGDGRIGSAETEAIGNYVMKTPASDPNFASGLAAIHEQFSSKAPNIQGYRDALDQWDRENPGQTMPPEENAKLLAQFGLSGRLAAATGGKGMGSSQQIKAQAIQEIMDRRKAEGKPVSIAEAEHEYNVTRSAPTGNQLDALQGKVDQAERIIDGSRKNLDFLRTYKGGAGLLGKVMRGEEIATNITGISTDTERVAFRRRVHELQEMAPRILVDANGRPLKAEQDKVNDVVAGLSAGDTGPNTIRAYEDLISEMEFRIQKYRERQGKAPPSSGAPQPAATGSTDWLSAYPEKK